MPRSKYPVYKHTFPTAALQTVYWATPWLQDFIMGTDVHNKWACRNYKSWVELLRPINTAYTSPMHTSTPMTVQGGTTFKLNYVHAMLCAMTHVLACCQWVLLLACLHAPPTSMMCAWQDVACCMQLHYLHTCGRPTLENNSAQ